MGYVDMKTSEMSSVGVVIVASNDRPLKQLSYNK